MGPHLSPGRCCGTGGSTTRQKRVGASSSLGRGAHASPCPPPRVSRGPHRPVRYLAKPPSTLAVLPVRRAGGAEGGEGPGLDVRAPRTEGGHGRPRGSSPWWRWEALPPSPPAPAGARARSHGPVGPFPSAASLGVEGTSFSSHHPTLKRWERAGFRVLPSGERAGEGGGGGPWPFGEGTGLEAATAPAWGHAGFSSGGSSSSRGHTSMCTYLVRPELGHSQACGTPTLPCPAHQGPTVMGQLDGGWDQAFIPRSPKGSCTPHICPKIQRC